MKKLVLSAHAKTVMTERSIQIEWVERVLSKPDETEPDSGDPDLVHALGRIPEHDNRVLRVVYNASIKPVRIVTAYFDRAMRNKL